MFSMGGMLHRCYRALPMDDRELLQAVATHDRAAFAEFFRRFAPRIKGFLAQSLSSGLAEEITQEVLLRVWRKAPTYDSSAGGAEHLGVRHRPQRPHRRAAPDGPGRAGS